MSLTAIATEIPFFLTEDAGGLEGPFAEIWDMLKSKLNFSLTISGMIDYGKIYSAQNATGILGSLIRNETQFSVVPQYLTFEAVQWLDYTMVLAREEWNIITGPPRTFVVDHFSSLNVFDPSLWMAVLVALILYSLSWTLMTESLQQHHSVMDFVKRFGDFVFSSVIVLVNQYRYVKSDQFYQRICWISWRLGCFCLSLSLTGTLLAKLAQKNEPFRYEELKDILDDPEMKFGMLANTPIYELMEKSTDIIEQSLFARGVRQNTVGNFYDLNLLDLFDDTKDGKLAFMMMTRAFYAVVYDNCGIINDVHVSKKVHDVTLFCLLTRKDLRKDIKKIVNFVAESVVECHIINKKVNFISTIGKMCSEPHTVGPTPLTIEKFYFIFMAYAFVISFAICSIIVEISLPPRTINSRKTVNLKRLSKNSKVLRRKRVKILDLKNDKIRTNNYSPEINSTAFRPHIKSTNIQIQNWAVTR